MKGRKNLRNAKVELGAGKWSIKGFELKKR
jgi:hypothetical protein